MYMISVLKHLIHQEACFPALKLVWDDQVDAKDFGELPKLTPSHYFNENRLNTKERHALLCRQQRKMPNSRKQGTEVIIEPPIIVFQNCEFGEKYSFPIVVRNISKNSQKVALLMDESFAFKFDECSQRVAKFPCGMCITATINFTPENATEDAYHRLVVSTNTSKVSVPIIAIGARPLLNTPDLLVFSDAPVKCWTVKPVTVLNTGKKVANFTLSAEGAFCVKPEKGSVPENQAFTFEVSYYSRSIESHEGEICLKFDNGEEVYMYVKANAVGCNINLSNQDVRCEDTFVSLQTRATFYIENHSSINAKFYWKMLREAPGRQVENSANKLNVSTVSANNVEASLENEIFKELEAPPLESKRGEGDAPQVFQCDKNISKIQSAPPDQLFSNDNFHVYPLFGEVKPNSKTEIHIVFSPTESVFYQGIAYLDIDGLDKRLPFTFYGRGLGPKFRMAFQVLDVGDVALGGAHTYEIPVQNVSEIPGTIKSEMMRTHSGMGMKIEPFLLNVTPDNYAAFYVNFTCTGKPGFFEHEIKFIVPETGEVFYVTVKGKITYPSIRFHSTEVYMGNLSFGFPKTYCIPLVNDSMNFVEVQLKMDTDGVDPPVDYNTILKSFKPEHFRLHNRPAEFKINPVKFTLRPKGLQKVQLTMFPNHVREIKNKLNCWITDEDGNDVETVASINLRGYVIVPTLQPIADSIHLKECLLQYPYNGEFIIKNPTELPVVYCLVQKPSTQIKFESDHLIGIAEPFLEVQIPFVVICSASGGAVLHFDVYAVGNDARQFPLTIRCECDSITQKFEASNKSVDFGKIEVLEEKILSVEVQNTSPLPFPFTSTCFIEEPNEQKGESWEVTPETGILEAQSKLTMTVNLLLKEVGYHYACIRIQMNEPLKHAIEVRMKALGVGSPLKFIGNPPLQRFCTIPFGTLFVKQEKSLEYEIINLGVNTRVLEWKPFGEKGPLNRPGGSINKAKRESPKDLFPSLPKFKAKGKGKKESPTKQKVAVRSFTINPTRIVIPPGETAKFSISSYSSVQKVYDEVWNLWSFVPVTKGLQVVDEETEERSPPRMPKIMSRKSINDKDKKKRASNEPQNLHLRPTIIAEAKLEAKYEAPELKFSKRSLNLLIEATPTHENFIMEGSVRIENTGTLPLKVRLSTKFPFSFSLRNESNTLMEEGTFYFDTHKSLVFNVQFDGRHLRRELGVALFDGKLEAHYEGIQGATECVDLHGEVRFPELEIDRTIVDFGTLTNGMEAVELINVKNTGPFCLTYKWYIKPGSSHIKKTPDPEWTKEFRFDSFQPSMKYRLFKYKHKNSLVLGDSEASVHYNVPVNTLLWSKRRSLYEMSSRDQKTQALGLFHSKGSLQMGESNYEDFTQFLEEKMYRSRMMEFMGLKDAQYEGEDEVNYMAYFNQNASTPKDEFNTNEIIDVLPLAGIIESGKSQTFTLVFYGYPDIDFKTSLILYVEGGARKTVEVTGKTVHPTTTQTI